jgi:hypothetical protein
LAQCTGARLFRQDGKCEIRGGIAKPARFRERAFGRVAPPDLHQAKTSDEVQRGLVESLRWMQAIDLIPIRFVGYLHVMQGIDDS